jgi:hypothetical protein
MNIKISLDTIGYPSKPEGSEIGKINDRIGNSQRRIDYAVNELLEVMMAIGEQGHTFCPATFKTGRRSKTDFEQMKLFALDFDNTISWEEVIARAVKYGLPILAAYETISSINRNKFRVLFLNDVSIDNIKVADVMILALMTIFPEADKQCKDASRMFYGGKSLFYFDYKLPEINVFDLLMSLGRYWRETTPKHYVDRMKVFSQKTGLRLTDSYMLDVRVEYNSSTNEVENGESSPESINTVTLYKKGNGDESPLLYLLNFIDTDTSTFGGTNKKKAPITGSHCEYRSDIFEPLLESCSLFRDFASGERWLTHHELTGIAMCMVNVDGGRTFFLNTLASHAAEYPSYGYKYEAWEYYLDYFSKSGYAPMNCCNFCPYESKCSHGANMLVTTKVKPCQVVKLENQKIKYHSLEEVRRDIGHTLFNILRSQIPYAVHVLKCQAGSGKSETLLKYLAGEDIALMSYLNHLPKFRCRIYVPTNKLKLELYNRAIAKKIPIMMYPSLFEEEIQEKIPPDAWGNIRFLYNTGKGKEVNEYIEKYLETHECDVLAQYLIDKKAADEFEGHIICTHHSLLYSSEEKLSRYLNIIDEDILSTILCNHTAISLADLKTVLEIEDLPKKLKNKITQAIYHIKHRTGLFRLPEIPVKNAVPNPTFDTALFNKAKVFYTDGEKIYFINIRKFELTNLIVLSATANIKIYSWYFGASRVQFHNCWQKENEGKVIQYCDRSMSRYYVTGHPDVYDEIEAELGKLPFISFKGKSRRTDYHINNCRGRDELKGENIAVIGTPHFPSWMYELIACTLGFDVTDTLRPQEVEHNGYRFRFMTYSDEILRTIQFWLIETELEQAVGRARVLIEDCIVYLFSNFMLLQSIHKEFKR